MKRVSKRELNQQTAQVLASAEAGKPVIVTERGVPRWRIVALGASEDPVDSLFLEGLIIPAAQEPPPWPTDEAEPYTHAQIDRLFAESRGER